MIKKILLLFCCVNVFTVCSVFAKDPDKGSGDAIYIDPGAAEYALKHFFGQVESDKIFPMSSGWNDKAILMALQRRWNRCLADEGQNFFISSDCVVDICNSVYNHILPEKRNDALKEEFTQYCIEFVRTLKNIKDGQNPTCSYIVEKVGTGDHVADPQQVIRFKEVQGNSGLVNTKGSLSQRMHNPGNVRESRLRCALLRIWQPKYKNGKKVEKDGKVVYAPSNFAAFASHDIGWLALRNLLRSDNIKQHYPQRTIRQAMALYAPDGDGPNNAGGYANAIKNKLVETAVANKRMEKAEAEQYYANITLGQMTDVELEEVMKKIEEVEGKEKPKTDRF